MLYRNQLSIFFRVVFFVFTFYLPAMDGEKEKLEATQDLRNILQQGSLRTIYQPIAIRSQSIDFFPVPDDESKPPMKLTKLKELAWYGRVALSNNAETIPEEYAHTVQAVLYAQRLKLWNEQLELLKTKAGQHFIVLPDTQHICCALHVATKIGLPIMVGLLLERGASKDWKNYLNRDARYYIHRAENEDAAVKVAKHLVKKPDDLGPLNWLGETVITFAKQDDKKKLLAYYQSIK